MKEFIRRNALYGAFAVSLVAMLGSLYYSNILLLPPCVLCWYQRICMYPLVVILGLAIYRRSRELVIPAIILNVIGLAISIYHNLLYFNILPESAAPCVAGISCTTRMPGWLASFPIPAQALVGFILILIALIIYWRTKND
jgi:disulfide bond formation protein DsbB